MLGNALEQEKIANRAGQLADRLLRLDLVILDALGYLPFSSSGGALLFHLRSKLYDRQRQFPVQKQLGRRKKQKDKNDRLTHARNAREMPPHG